MNDDPYKSLAVVRITDATDITNSALHTMVSYINKCNNMNRLGNTEDWKDHPYISHMATMEDSNGGHLFGLTNSANNSGDGHGVYNIVWRVELDTATGALISNYHTKVLDSGDFGTDSKFIGLSATMEYDGANYWIHCIY